MTTIDTGTAPRSPNPRWESLHRRTVAVRDVIARLDRGDELVWDAEVFPELADVLAALHGVWSRRLLGRVDLALELQDRPELAVAEAWRATAIELPGVRRVLDEFQDHPALAAHERSEHRMLAVAVGRATLTDPVGYSAREGRDFVAGVRADGDRGHPHRRTGRWNRVVGLPAGAA